MTSFNSKETYLQYRAAWKQRYKALSAEIRVCKAWRREEARLATVAFSRTDIYNLREPERTKVLNEFIPADKLEMVLAARKQHMTPYGGYSATWTCKELGTEATEMLEELKQAKIEAQRQYLETRKSLAATPLAV